MSETPADVFVAPVTRWGWASRVEPEDMEKALEWMLRFHFDHPRIPIAGCPACKALLDRYTELAHDKETRP